MSSHKPARLLNLAFFLAAVLAGLVLSPAALAMDAEAGREMRSAGFMIETVGINTSRINALIPADQYAPLGSRMVMKGVEGIVGGQGDWAFGGFRYGGRIAAQQKTNRAELELTMVGASVQTLLQHQGNIDYVGEIKAGGGRITWTMIHPSAPIADLDDAVNNATATILETPIWFVAPSIGLRMQFSPMVMFEAKLGYGLSMNSGEWRYAGRVIGTAHVNVGGPSVSVGVKLGTF